jgi:hypothetical protein
MSPRFELLTTLPAGQTPKITTQYRMSSLSLKINFEQPAKRSITFDGWVCEAFALNPGCTPELGAKLAPGIYCIQESPWVRNFSFTQPSLRTAPATRHFLFLFGDGTRIDFATSKATITDNSPTIEAPPIKRLQPAQDPAPVRLSSRCEQCIALPSISYEPADDLAMRFQLTDVSTLEVYAANDFTSERQDVRFIGTSSFIFYSALIQSEKRPCEADFAEMIGCRPSCDAGIFAHHLPGLKSFYFGLRRYSFLEAVCRDQAIL